MCHVGEPSRLSCLVGILERRFGDIIAALERLPEAICNQGGAGSNPSIKLPQADFNEIIDGRSGEVGSKVGGPLCIDQTQHQQPACPAHLQLEAEIVPILGEPCFNRGRHAAQQ